MRARVAETEEMATPVAKGGLEAAAEAKWMAAAIAEAEEMATTVAGAEEMAAVDEAAGDEVEKMAAAVAEMVVATA